MVKIIKTKLIWIFLSILGADVPACFYGDDCLITGIGNEIYTKINHPKYYFVLVKPNINLSTKYVFIHETELNIGVQLHYGTYKNNIRLKFVVGLAHKISKKSIKFC